MAGLAVIPVGQYLVAHYLVEAARPKHGQERQAAEENKGASVQKHRVEAPAVARE
jgi:hypothetical protein